MKGFDKGSSSMIKAQLKNPTLLNSTKLHKYVATVSQIFSVNKLDLDLLACHLGLDIRAHYEYYRLLDSTAELAKVSKLLMVVDTLNPEE